MSCFGLYTTRTLSGHVSAMICVHFAVSALRVGDSMPPFA
jgi:hypothetical protein